MSQVISKDEATLGNFRAQRGARETCQGVVGLSGAEQCANEPPGLPWSPLPAGSTRPKITPQEAEMNKRADRKERRAERRGKAKTDALSILQKGVAAIIKKDAAQRAHIAPSFTDAELIKLANKNFSKHERGTEGFLRMYILCERGFKLQLHESPGVLAMEFLEKKYGYLRPELLSKRAYLTVMEETMEEIIFESSKQSEAEKLAKAHDGWAQWVEKEASKSEPTKLRKGLKNLVKA